MLAPVRARRHPSYRAATFRPVVWDDDHPEFLRRAAALPLDHPARACATIVAHLDLTACHASYQGYGTAPFPVARLLPFVLFMYSEGHLSPARWSREACSTDPARWLLRGLRPSRSCLFLFRDRCAPFIDDLLRQLTAWAIAEGITTATRGSLDGTFIAALASRHQLCTEARLDRRLLLLRLLVWLEQGQPANLAVRLTQLPDLLLAALALTQWEQATGVPPTQSDTFCGLVTLVQLLGSPTAPEQPLRLPAWVPTTPSGRVRVLRRWAAARQRLAQRLDPLRRKQKKSKQDERTLRYAKVSLTDPDAALGWDKVGTYRPLYNLQLVQATDAPLTLAFDVLPRNNDDGLLRPMMEKTKQQLGRHLGEVLVDGAFTTVLDVAWCAAQDITVYAPPQRAATPPESAAATPPVPGGAKKKKQQAEKLPKSAFRYDAAARVYHCPEGKPLAELTQTTTGRSGGLSLEVIVHRAAAADCQGCPRRGECTSSQHGRTVKRYVGEEALERLAARMAEPASKEIYKERGRSVGGAWAERGRSVELGYADLKEHRGLRVFRCYSLWRARAQAGLVILASTGRKLLRLLQNRNSTAPPRENAAA